MKYYIYVSDAKIDMLFAQIPQRLSRRISGELKLDFKIVSLALRPQTEPATRYGKLSVVVEYLHRHETVGTIAMPGTYVTGTERMRWTIVGTTAIWLARRGTTELVLTGAAHHMTGNAPRGAELTVDSLSYMAVEIVAKALAEVEATDLAESPTLEEDVLSSVGFIASTIHGPTHELEFMAIRYGTEDVRGRQWGARVEQAMRGVDMVLLASPLFVALA